MVIGRSPCEESSGAGPVRALHQRQLLLTLTTMRGISPEGETHGARTVLDLAILVGAILCALVAAWLIAAILLVLPGRAPGSIPAWTFVAVGLLALATLRGRRSAGGARSAVRDGATAALAALAVLAGAWLALGPILGSAEFEGYVLLVAAAAVGQGLLVLARFTVARGAA